MKKLFGEINLSWKKTIIFAVLTSVYTAIMAMIPITKNTSFRDIAISFEVWILFGVLIIMNSKSPKDSALKCFVFFLISQPLVYIFQDVINGSNLFSSYYRFWVLWTIATIPMGFIGYYMKKDKWWGLIILLPMLLFLGIHYCGFLAETIYYFPYHLLSALFCLFTMIIYPIYIFNNKNIKYTGLVLSLIIIIIMTFIALTNGITYKTIVLVSDSETGETFDDSYKVYLDNESLGKVYIIYDKNLEDYEVEAKFKRAGKSNLILEDSNGNKTIYEIDVKRDNFNKIKK